MCHGKHESSVSDRQLWTKSLFDDHRSRSAGVTLSFQHRCRAVSSTDPLHCWSLGGEAGGRAEWRPNIGSEGRKAAQTAAQSCQPFGAIQIFGVLLRITSIIVAPSEPLHLPVEPELASAATLLQGTSPSLVLACYHYTQEKLVEVKDACGVRMAFLPRPALLQQQPREGYINGGRHVCAAVAIRRSSSNTISPSVLDPQAAVTCERGAAPS